MQCEGLEVTMSRHLLHRVLTLFLYASLTELFPFIYVPFTPRLRLSQQQYFIR